LLNELCTSVEFVFTKVSLFLLNYQWLWFIIFNNHHFFPARHALGSLFICWLQEFSNFIELTSFIEIGKILSHDTHCRHSS
jgi:hypothetical protein